jgi:transcriptional regulator with XRE-family HTH domain
MASSIAAAMQGAKVAPKAGPRAAPTRGYGKPLGSDDMKAINDAFGKSIRMRREALGFSQSEMTEILGLASQTNLSGWETGKSNPTLHRAAQIAAVLGVNLNAIAAHVECATDKAKLEAAIQQKNASIDEEITAAEARLAELRQRKAFSTRVIHGGR